MNLFFRAQRKTKKLLREYLLKNEFIKNSKYGFRIKLDISKDVDKFFYWGEFERDNLQFYKNVLNRGSIIFDVGANIGIYSLLASKIVGNEGRIYSFEPSEWAYNRLIENIKLNNFKNINTYKLGISNKEGTVIFHKCEDDAYNSIGNHPMRKITEVSQINVISIDEFCKKNSIERIDVIKVDIEGADFLALKGAKMILSSLQPPIIFYEYNRGISEGFNFKKNDLHKLLDEYLYQSYSLINNKLVKFNPVIHNSNEIICLQEYHKIKYRINVN